MKVAVVQHDIVWEDKDANFARLAPQVEAAAATGARLVVLASGNGSKSTTCRAISCAWRPLAISIARSSAFQAWSEPSIATRMAAWVGACCTPRRGRWACPPLP